MPGESDDRSVKKHKGCFVGKVRGGKQKWWGERRGRGGGGGWDGVGFNIPERTRSPNRGEKKKSPPKKKPSKRKKAWWGLVFGVGAKRKPSSLRKRKGKRKRRGKFAREKKNRFDDNAVKKKGRSTRVWTCPHKPQDHSEDSPETPKKGRRGQPLQQRE